MPRVDLTSPGSPWRRGGLAVTWIGDQVIALELASGTQLWASAVSSVVADRGLPLLVNGDTVYATSLHTGSKTMIALNDATGATRWTFAAAGDTCGQAAGADTVYLTTDVGICSLDAASGTQRRLFTTRSPRTHHWSWATRSTLDRKGASTRRVDVLGETTILRRSGSE
jgi:outer membrane protein assembly factor BamB